MDSNISIQSPLTSRANAKLVSKWSTAHVIRKYRDDYGIDVSDYFTGMTFISVYECEESGYRFFYPYSLAGKDALYQHLGKFPWFYQHDKWEHNRALRLLRPGQKVLDVGCGTGNFLAAAKELDVAEAVGIELNPDSAAIGCGRGLRIEGELIDVHARNRPNYYDVVTAFQVLEHIPDVGSFINSCLEALKPSGILIFGVPNCSGFLKYDDDAVLNGPPHHMGWWSSESLEALCRIFPIEIVYTEFEPLKEIAWYQSVMEKRYLSKKWIRSLYYRLGVAKVFNRFLVENSESISGHTIMAVFRKN